MTNHSWGEIRCPDGACTFLIYSTGTAPEGPAKTAQRKIERCPHAVDVDASISSIDTALTTAERLVDAAEHLAGRDEADRLRELLEAAEGLVDDAAAWDEFGQLVDEADRHGRAAEDAFDAAGQQPVPAGEALTAAEEHVSGARTALKQPQLPSGEVRRLKVWVSALRARIAAVRTL